MAARVDDLTGCANRRHFYDAVQAELLRSQRRGQPCTTIYMDLDGFRAENDRWGHRTGDKVLCTVVNQATSHSRQTDLVDQLGGDEFVVLLPEIGTDAARNTAPKLQAGFASGSG